MNDNEQDGEWQSKCFYIANSQIIIGGNMGKFLDTLILITALGAGAVSSKETLKGPSREIPTASLVQKATPEMVEQIRDYEIVSKLSVLNLTDDINGFLMLIDPKNEMVMLGTPVDIDTWGTPERAANAFMQEFPYIFANIHYDETRKMYYGVFINISKHIRNHGLTDPQNLVNQLLEIGADELTAERISEQYVPLYERVSDMPIYKSSRSSCSYQRPEKPNKPKSKEYRKDISQETLPIRLTTCYPLNAIEFGFNNSTKVPSIDIAVHLIKGLAVDIGAEYSNKDASNMEVNAEYMGKGIYVGMNVSYRISSGFALNLGTDGLVAKKNSGNGYAIVPSTYNAGISIMTEYLRFKLINKRKIFSYFPYDENMFPAGQNYVVNLGLDICFPGLKFLEWSLNVQNIYYDKSNNKIVGGFKPGIGVVW